MKHRSKLIHLSALLCAVVFLLPLYGFAQGLARISGTVTDPTGATVPNATVVASQVATGAKTSVTANGDGAYVFPSLVPGEYSIDVTSTGFSRFLQTNVTLQADQALTVNVILKIGSSTETVNVDSAPPQVDTTTGTLAQVIDEKRVNDLPLNGRNAAALTTLVPGVVNASNLNIDQGQTKTFPGAVTVTINGTRANQVNYMLDGGNNVDEYTNVNAPFPFPDALQEFSVQTSNYSAEYGQNAGAVVNIVTRSGGNKFHGDAFEYVRNRVFNAANYFSYVNGVKTVDPLKRNQFGGTLNGPVIIPHLYHGGDKTFFSFGVQSTRIRTNGVSGTATLPTPAQLAGTFTGLASPTAIRNPKTLAPYPCTPTGTTFTCQVNPADFNQSSLALLKFLPKITGTDGTAQFFRPVNQNFIEYLGRVDQVLSSKDRLSLRYYYDSFDNAGVLDTTNLLSYSDQAGIRYHNALISETHTFTDKLFNTIIVSYQIENASRGPVAGAPDVNDLGVNIWQPAFKQINQIQLVNFFTIGDNPAATFRRNNYTLADDLRWVVGNHTFGFGFHGELAKVDVDNQFQQPGAFKFDSNATIADPMADYLLGALTTFQQASGQFFNNRYKVTGYYAQDSWKASRRLTLNFGVRYEPFLPQEEKLGREGMFSPAARAAGQISTTHPTALAGLLFPGDMGFVHNMVDPVYTHFMPRLGFAYDVFGDGKTSLRGGIGQFYDTRLPGVFNNIFANSVPYVASVNVTYAAASLGNFSNPYANIPGGNVFPAPQPPPANYFTTANYQNSSFTTFNPNTFRIPVTYSWNLAVEQQLSNTISSRIAYVASKSSHQINPTDINPIYNQGPNVGQRVFASTNNVQNYTQQIATVDTGGNATYHSLQASLQKRVTNGLTGFLNYTWSKAIDDNAFGSSVTAVVPGSSYVLPVYERDYKRLDRGPSDYDHRNVIAISYVWLLPKMTNGNSIVRYVANNWQTNGIFQLRSGDPLTVTGANVSGTGVNRDRAIWNGQNPYGGNACASVSASCKSFLNPASFSQNPAATVNVPLSYGNIVKGSFVGPRFTSWDVSLMRLFPVHEGTQFQFRAEYFNVLNHTNFMDPQLSQPNTAFGRITQANDPRIAQLSLKLLF
ncbi:carboxypeptidase regulatory-like domain-containing protein [Granulicella sp. dw_53]|uniref:TonB-dependent receptor n=1 Tax=Granulicella sp. dw_53 TaxID=2719792 RepID=UPI001BD3897A|nr:carboxypeptidase regulatory-like domain-containing protein [Granulicella sp. dw_53]